MRIKAIHDNKGKTFDRYTVVFEDGMALGLSHNPDSPIGFSQWGSAAEGVDLGKTISLEELPERVHQHIKIRLTPA
jgi:hypothetical protein